MRKVLIGTLFLTVLIIVVFAIYWGLKNQEDEEIKQECFSAAQESTKCLTKNSTLEVCRVNDDKIVPLENLTNLTFQCGERIMYTIRMNAVTKLPEKFYFCDLYDKLLNTTEFRCGGVTSYVNNGKQVFTCWHKLLDNSTGLMFFYKGIVPNTTGDINLLEFYVYSPTNEEISQDYFWNNINAAQKLYTLHGEVVC